MKTNNGKCKVQNKEIENLTNDFAGDPVNSFNNKSFKSHIQVRC